MNDFLITECLRTGILTTTPCRKYPLRHSNIAIVLKAYALSKHLPYTIKLKKSEDFDEYTLYLTEEGLEWLYSSFRQYSLPFLRRVFRSTFVQATEYDIQHLEQYAWLGNIRGTKGVQPKAGTVQRAVLVRRVGRANRETEYDNILEAREAIFELLKYYPAEQFTLYRIRKSTKNNKIYYFRNEIPLILPESKRGVIINLPNVKKEDV